MARTIDINVAFIITEIEVNRINKTELKIELIPNGRSFTPYGAFELGKQLIKWAANADSGIEAIVNQNTICNW
jgi:hypothetical protein